MQTEPNKNYERISDLRIPMRDGVELSADVYLLARSGCYPTILIRTPYSNEQSEFQRLALANYVDAGYAVVYQSVRGRGKSQGSFGFFFVEGEDGYDSIEWIAAQSWCDGNIGMDGGSYLGTVQWLAAREKPPHLKCILPCVPAGDYFNEVPYLGGALHLDGTLAWQAALQNVEVKFTDEGETNLEKYRPLAQADKLLGLDLPLFREFLQHPTLDDYWRRIYFDNADFNAISIPVMKVTGWFDGDQSGSLFYWRGLESSESHDKSKHRLIIGPWTHQQCYLGGELQLEELEFSKSSLYPLQSARLAFFDAYLKGEHARIDDTPRVQVFITGKNQWRTFDTYPPASVEYKSMYLHSQGKANSCLKDGSLSMQESTDPTPDTFIFNPLDPVPYSQGGTDLQQIEQRQDILVFSSEVLMQPLEIIGPVSVELYAASDALDTDFVARLVDVHPDGRAVNLSHTRGVIRARYRQGYESPKLLTPGKVEKYSIRLMDLGHSFLPGHRVRLEITSSCFPLIDPNTNTGTDFSRETHSRIATQTVYHDQKRPSCLRLPVFCVGE